MLSMLRRPPPAGATLSLLRLEQLLGDRLFLEMMAGEHPRLTAAIKSLPLREGGDVSERVPAEERQLAGRLIKICEDIMAGPHLSLEFPSILGTPQGALMNERLF